MSYNITSSDNNSDNINMAITTNNISQYLFPKHESLKFKLSMCTQYIIETLKRWNVENLGIRIDIYSEKEKQRFVEFVTLLDKYINDLDDDLLNYSKYKFKITLELNGFDEDEAFLYIRILRNIFIDNRIGVLDLRKPVELSNNIIALIEF